MKIKILYLVLFLSIGIKSYAYDSSFIQVSSDQFASVQLDSGSAPTVVPSTVTFSINGLRQINYSNPSSSSTIYFGTAPSNANSLRDYGFPIFPLQSISIDRDPAKAYQSSSTSNTMYYFTRQDGSNEVGTIPIKVWLRYSE